MKPDRAQDPDGDPAMAGTGDRGRHCWNCGQRLQATPPTQCSVCGQHHYVNPKPAGEAVVIRDGRVLLIQRARDPWRGRWDIPGGFCEGNEHPMHAAERELLEEVGVAARAQIYLGTWMDVYGPPAADGLQEYTANSAYLVGPVPEANDGVDAQTDEVTAVQWFSLTSLPTDLAFPAHVPRVLEVAVILSERASVAELYDRSW